MNPQQLKVTSLAPEARKLIQAVIPEKASGETTDLIDRLMGKNPETRFQFITENAEFAEELDI